MKIDNLTPENIQELAAQYNNYKTQAENIYKQINFLKTNIEEIDMAIGTIKSISEETEDKEILVPIGYSVFLNAKITNRDKLVVAIGAGYSAEKKIDESLNLLEKRKKELTKYYEELNERLVKISKEMQNIEKIAKKYEKIQESKKPLQAN